MPENIWTIQVARKARVSPPRASTAIQNARPVLFIDSRTMALFSAGGSGSRSRGSSRPCSTCSARCASSGSCGCQKGLLSALLSNMGLSTFQVITRRLGAHVLQPLELALVGDHLGDAAVLV